MYRWSSNVPGDFVCLLPEDPDASARRVRGDVLLAGLMRDVGPPILGYQRQRQRHCFIQYLRTETATHHQHFEIAAAVAESPLGRR